jgi:hypothetical protein
MKKHCVWMFGLLFILFSVSAFAQQEKGDKEFGMNGVGFFTHSDPMLGMVSVQGTFGKYLSVHDYVGATVGPGLEFSNGDVTGNIFYGGNYRRLFGKQNAKVYPFIGAQGGAYTYLQSSGNTTYAMVAPEVGFKFYASQRNAFEVSYQLMIQVNNVPSGSGFGDRALSYISFGFKHLFGHGK